MDGFATEAARARPRGGDDDDDAGRFALGYYDAKDLPFYYFLANTFTICGPLLQLGDGGHWPTGSSSTRGRRSLSGRPPGALTGASTTLRQPDPRRRQLGGLHRRAAATGLASAGPGRRRREADRGAVPGAAGRNVARRLVPGIRRRTTSTHRPTSSAERPGRAGCIKRDRQPGLARAGPVHHLRRGGRLLRSVPPPPACPPDGGRAEYRLARHPGPVSGGVPVGAAPPRLGTSSTITRRCSASSSSCSTFRR